VPDELSLRYGLNPHQKPARAIASTGRLPFRVLNGEPGYINLLDALNAWQLVRELRHAAGLPAAASFKHVSPAGAAVATPLSPELAEAYFVKGDELSLLATAYARARGADRLSSFGDIAALSEEVDLPTATLMAREVSDGVIAPAYDAPALDILRHKRGGRYLILQMDPAYVPSEIETREVFGVTLEQRHDDATIEESLLNNVVTREKLEDGNARRDLLIAMITAKYAQSNSVALAFDGQAIGVGAGQQSRIHCTILACEKAERWWLRQHERARAIGRVRGRSRPERDNDIEQFVRSGLSAQERAAWLARLTGVSLASDAYFPFRDNIDRAHESGTRYIAQPGGSRRDAEVIAACDEYGIAMAMTGLRLFHH
jgi:AICAR transformylase/IMP cyclohydrolase PurH